MSASSSQLRPHHHHHHHHHHQHHRRRPASLLTLPVVLGLLVVALQLRHFSLVVDSSAAAAAADADANASIAATNTASHDQAGEEQQLLLQRPKTQLEAAPNGSRSSASGIKEVFGEGMSLADAAEAAGNAMALPGTQTFGRRVKRFIVSQENYDDGSGSDPQDESNQAAKAPGNIEFLPEKDITNHYASCAVVGNAGTLLAAPFGAAIDSHDAVFRFNDGPTEGFEKYAGNRTTMRIINNNWTRQWQKKRPHKIADHTEGTLVLIGKNSLRSSRLLFEKRRTKSLVLSPEFGVAARKAYKDSYSVLEALKVVQVSGRNTAPSGIEGLFLAMAFCSRVRVFGFGVLPRFLSNSLDIQHDLQRLSEDHKPSQALDVESPGEAAGFGHGIAGLPYHYHDNVQGVEAAHSFGYQSMFLRLLELLGHVEICVPNVLDSHDTLPAGCSI